MHQKWTNLAYLAARLGTYALAFGLLLLPARAVDVQEITTDAGIDYWLVSDSTVPLVTINFSFLGGSVLDPNGKEGLANLMSTMLDEGAGEMDSQSFQAALENNSIRLSFDASTERFGGTLRTLSSNQDSAFELLALAINQPRFDEEPIARMKSQIIAGIRGDLNDPDTIASRTWFKTAYAGHPYGRTRKGTVETVGGLLTSDLRAAHEAIFTRGGLKIAVVGDIDAATASLAIDQVFAELPMGEDTLEIIQPAEIFSAGIFHSLEKPQTIMWIGGESIGDKHPDFITAYVVNHIFGGGSFTSRLYKEVRESRGLAYSVSSFLGAFDEGGFFIVRVGTRTANAAQAKDIIKQEIQRMADTGPTAQELRAAKDFLKGAYALRFDSSSKIASQLVGLQVQGRSADYINQRNGRIEAVTLEDAKRVARSIFSAPLLDVVVGAQSVDG